MRLRKITIRLTDELAGALTPEKLKFCGYPTRQAWAWACIKRLEAEYAARCRHKKPTPDGETPATEAQGEAVDDRAHHPERTAGYAPV